MEDKKTMWYVAAGVVLLLIIGLLYTYTNTSNQAGTLGPTNQVLVRLTDPPHVPLGTQHLVAVYSSAQVHVSGNGGVNGNAGWVSASGAGSVDLMALINVSQTIAKANVSANATIDQVRFNVTSATITINGITSNVTLTNRQITTHVTGRNKVSANASILLDLSPTVVTIFTLNSTVYVLVPSVKAVVIGAAGASVSERANASVRAKSKVEIGDKMSLDVDERAVLEAQTPNITVTGLVVATNGNVTRLSVTVKDNSNASVKIKHVLLFGTEQFEVAVNAVPSIRINEDDGINVNAGANGTIRINTHRIPNIIPQDKFSISGSVNGSVNANAMNGNVNSNSSIRAKENETFGGSVKGNESGLVNITANGNTELDTNVHINVTEEASENATFENREDATLHENATVRISSDAVRIAAMQRENGVLNFMVSANGTLVLPFTGTEFEGDTGFTLGAGQSATLNYTGSVVLGEGHVVVSLIPSSTYKVEVVGEESARASASVQAVALASLH